jgi:translocation and assembly module TamB
MGRVRRGLTVAGVVLATLLVAVLLAVLVVGGTDAGRGWVRDLVLETARRSINGNLEIGELDGHLLGRTILRDVVVEDTQGRPFLSAEAIALRLDLPALLRQRIILQELHFQRPEVQLRQPPGGEWNAVRIFAPDTARETPPPASGDTTGSFGSFVVLNDVTIAEGNVTVRLPWSPGDAAVGEARDSIVQAALAGELRPRVEEGPEGLMQVMEFREVEATLPEVVVARPGTEEQLFALESGSLVALPFHPPAARVEHLEGRVMVSPDSIRMEELQVELPESRLAGRVAFHLESGGLAAAVDARPVSLADLRFLQPELPRGEGTLEVGVNADSAMTRVVARGVDLSIQEARITGGLQVAFGDTLLIGDSELAFTGVETGLLEQLAGGGDPLPVEGTLRGSLATRGAPGDLTVEGWVELQDPRGRVSRLELDGGLTPRDRTLVARGLRIRLDPVQPALLRELGADLPRGGVVRGEATLRGPLTGALAVDASVVHVDPEVGRSEVVADGVVDAAAVAFQELRIRLSPLRLAIFDGLVPELPIGGTLEGTATLDGALGTRLAGRVDMTHVDTTGTTSVQGTAAWEGSGESAAFQVDLALPRVAMPTLSALVPGVNLAGSARGRVEAGGTLERPTFEAALVTSDSGSVGVAGSLDRAGTRLDYRLLGTLERLDVGLWGEGFPASRISGNIALEGSGTDPATARAALAATLVETRRGSPPFDSTRIRAAISDGILTVAQGELALGPARGTVEGTFGLVAEREGELRYQLRVDSLGAFQDMAPQDTTRVVPRPLRQARRLALARADSMRVAEATMVQRAATGFPPPPTLEVDSLPPLDRETLAGSIEAQGVLSGNLEGFDLRGTAGGEGLVAMGSGATSIQASYTLVDVLTPDTDVAVEAALDEVSAAGFGFDSVRTTLAFQGVRDAGGGMLELALFQDPDRDYRLGTDFLLEVDRREMTLAELVLRFDTARWAAPHPSTVALSDGDLTVDSLELLAEGGGGRIFLDGTVPGGGGAELELDLEVERLPLGHVTGLLQDTTTTRGFLDFAAQVTGTRAAPMAEGSAGLTEVVSGDYEVPDLQVAYRYGDRRLEADATLVDNGRAALSADIGFPVDLALDRPPGPRVLEESMRVAVTVDSLPLESLPSFTDAVEDIRGTLRADVVATGTPSEPSLDGAVALDLASLHLVPTGVTYSDIHGRTRLEGTTVWVDSIRTLSGRGRTLLSGSVDIEEWTSPRFDLVLASRRALLLDNERGRIRADADLALAGPLDAAVVEGILRLREGVIRAPEVGKTRRFTSLDTPEVRALVEGGGASELIPDPNPLLENLRLDLGVQVDRNNWVRNSEANVEVYTPEGEEPLRVRMNRDEPGLVLDGVINADRGSYTFSGRVFTLTTGTATFLPGGELDPLLQLTANYEIPRPGQEALVIQIHVTGSLTDPRVALESSAQPPLPESDLLSYLAFGRSSSTLLGGGGSGLSGGDGQGIGGLAQQQLASLAIGALLDELVADLEREGSQAGLDVFRVHPADLPPELAFSGQFGNFLRGTELVMGKYLGSRLFLAAQGRPTTEAWPGFRVEYTAPNGFSWETFWEPRYLPVEPSLSVDQSARSSRVLGSFLFWRRRF